MKHLKYLRYVLRHKWYTFIECCKLGVPLLGLLHDLSKFSWSEWSPYVEYFYGKRYSDHDLKLAASLGVFVKSDAELEYDFNVAWNHHQKRNKHHWQYWVLREDEGYMVVLPMPDQYRREMLADWKGAGKALGKPDTRTWYLKNRNLILLHVDTRQWIEAQLEIVMV